jgi:hypothetical protein
MQNSSQNGGESMGIRREKREREEKRTGDRRQRTEKN